MWSEFQKKILFFCWHGALHWQEEHRDLCRFWLWYYFVLWSSYKTQINQPRAELHFQILWKTQVHSSNDQHNCSTDEQHSFIIFLNPYNLWKQFQQVLRHSTTLTIDTLCPISTLNQQLTNLEQTHIRCVLHCERWTVKGKDCASALHSFKEITYRMGEWTKPLLQLKNYWVTCGNQEQWMELLRLWWTVVVFKCNYLFQLYFGAIFNVFSKKYFVCSISLLSLSEK